MPRVATPELEKLKQRIVDLEADEAAQLREWFELLLDVREADRKAQERKNSQQST